MTEFSAVSLLLVILELQQNEMNEQAVYQRPRQGAETI